MGCGGSKTTPQNEDAPLLKAGPSSSPEPKQTEVDSSPEKTKSGYSKLPQTDEGNEDSSPEKIKSGYSKLPPTDEGNEEPGDQQRGGDEDASKEAKPQEIIEDVEE